MTENADAEQAVHRRQALKGIGATAGAFGLGVNGIGLTTAQDSSYDRGDSLFIETKVEYDGLETSAQSTGTGLLNYVVDTDRDRVTLNGDLTEYESADVVLTNGSSFTTGGTSIPAQRHRRSLTATTDYRRQNERLIPLAQPATIPAITATSSGETVTLRVQGQTASVSPGEEVTLELEPTPVTVHERLSGDTAADPADQPSTKTRKVTPRITATNHGQLTVYSGTDVRIIPLDVDDPYARSRARSYIEVAPQEVVEQTEQNLLVVEETQEMTADKKQKLAEIQGGEN
jgi:hypothetical protein